MSKNPVKTLAVFRRLKMYRLETGFSMLEAVVVVGVLLALAVGGFIAYGPIIENAEKAKVQSAATDIYTAVTVASFDGDPATKPEDIVQAFNDSNDTIKAEILESPEGIGAMSATGSAPTGKLDFCVQVMHVKKPNIKSRVGTCSDGAGDPTPGDGSNIGVTFDAVIGASPRGIRWINAELAYNASAAARSEDWDTVWNSSEYIEEEAAYDELTSFELAEYASDPYSRLDSGLPELNADYRSKLAVFDSDKTVTNQQAMVTAYRAVFATALANPIPESDRVLVPAPSNPEKFQGVTIASGSGEALVVRVALPTALYDPNISIGAMRKQGVNLGANTVGIDGDHTYWDVTLTSSTWVTDPDGTITGTVWNTGTYDAGISVLDNRGVSHVMEFIITVQ
jgi:type II secretory pathway pseudopilin PulG